jgi:hypothetical protein
MGTSTFTPQLTTNAVMGAFPKGIILPWTDMNVPLPPDWHFCDETNHTPTSQTCVSWQQ